jgi:hypothetical protein
MGQGTFKVDEVIEVTYQATASTTGLVDVTMEIYDETGAKDGVNFPDVVMTEIGASGRYKGQFTPDQQGKWRVMIDSATKPGKLVKDYDVVGHNSHSIGEKLESLQGGDGDTLETLSDQIDGIPTSVDQPPMIG